MLNKLWKTQHIIQTAVYDIYLHFIRDAGEKGK